VLTRPGAAAKFVHERLDAVTPISALDADRTKHTTENLQKLNERSPSSTARRRT